MNIILQNVYKKFSLSDNDFPLLNNISIEFKAGVSYAVCGKSGSGKSTLLHMLAGFESQNAGNIRYNPNVRPRIGFMFQQPYLIAELSVLENVLLAGLLCGQTRKEAERNSLQLLEYLELIDKKDSIPSTLSGGQQQRVAFARALVINPAFLIADEPTNNLDDATAKIIIALLSHYQRQGTGVIVSSHDKALIQTMNVKLWLSNGILIAQDNGDD
jgi:ABC-type lipoprotein export system ATPase subunit